MSTDKEKHTMFEVAGGQDREDPVRELLRQAGPRPAVPAEDLAAIRAAARKEWQAMVRSQRSSQRRRWAMAALPAAATLALAILGGWWWLQGRGPESPRAVASVERADGSIYATSPRGWERKGLWQPAAGDALPAGAELTTEASAGARPPARISLRLERGESLRLAAESRVRLVTARRIELLRGTLYIDTGAASPDEEPFEVVTRYGNVQDLGTQFEVKLVEGGEAMARVRVREGSVLLRRDGDPYAADAGEELTVRPDGSVMERRIEVSGPEWLWVLESAPGIEIEGRSLAALLTWVGRETGWKIRFESERLEEMTSSILLHGSIAGLRPDQAMEVMLQGSGLEYRLEDGTALVLEPAAGEDAPQ